MDFNQKQKNLLFGALGILSLGGIVSIVSADMGEIRINSDFNYAPQHIEEVVFVPDGATRYDTDKLIHMNLQGGIITVSDSIVAGTSGGNSMSGVENSFILWGKGNKITAPTNTTTSWSIIGGGSGNKIENSNYAIILGGKDNTISAQANESIILWGEGNSVEKGKGIIIGNRNRITNKQNGKETIVIGNNIAVTGSDNVLMGKDYQFSGTNSFVWSTKNEKITWDNEFIIKNTHGMAINLDKNEIDGVALALKGSLKIWEGTSDLTGNIEGAIKRMGDCLCYNDGKNWKPTKADLICGIMCRSEQPKPWPTPNTCLSWVLLKSASNMSGDYRSCIGVSGTDLITKTYTNCHTGFYFFSWTNTTTQISWKTYEGTGVCKEQTQYANCEGTKISANETLYFPSSIQQTWSGTMQEFLGRAQWYYNDSLISGTCAYTCNNGYSYKLDTTDGVCRKLIVTFDPDGWTLATTTKNYTSWAKLGNNTPTKKGYTFSGRKIKETAYVTDKRGKIISTDKYEKGTLVNSNTLVRTDLQLWANWKANQYKITYQLNGGTGSQYPTTVTFGDTFSVTQPIKSGYLFNGWDIKGMDDSTHFYGSFTTTKTTLSGTKETSFKNLNATNGATVTFTANWSPNSYLIDYDLDGGTFSKTQPTSPLFDQTFSVENPTKPGHTFLWWTISWMDLGSHICGGKTTTAQSISGITGTNFKNLTHQNRATIFFTAQWKKNSFLFDLNGYLDGELSGFLWGYGTCDIYINGVLRANDDPIGTVIEDIPYGSTYEVKDCKANYGYVFGGWCVDVADNHGKMSGTFTDSDIRVAVIFNKEAKINGKCGTNGCLQGTKINEKETSNKITWTCEGLFGGTNQSCQTCKEHYTWSTCQGETLSCGTAPSYAMLWASSYTFAGTLKTWTNKVSGTLGACDFRCNENYERNASKKACEWKILSCGTQPEHSEIWAETYRFAWTLKNWNYKATGSLWDCDFRCQSNYTRNATTKKCEADTQTGTCTGLPDHAKWNVSTFKQTWNGSIWDPAQKVGVLATAGECSYSCNTGYEGTNCTAKTITVKYINETDITTGTATYDQNYTLLSAPTKEGYSFLWRSGENKLYSGGATLSKTLINKAITGGKSSIDFEAIWKKDYDTATLVPGSVLNGIFKQLAGDETSLTWINPLNITNETIKAIKRIDYIPEGITPTLISVESWVHYYPYVSIRNPHFDFTKPIIPRQNQQTSWEVLDLVYEESSWPVYAWFDAWIIYYFSEAKTIFINQYADYMFRGFSIIEQIDLWTMDTSKVTSMHNMFGLCSNLRSLDLSNFNTHNVFNMSHMFGWCNSLTSLNLSSFDTKNVIDMQGMFHACSSLTDLNLSSFNTENVIDMHAMFHNCSSLTDLNLSSFNTENVTHMESMFNWCTHLSSLDLSNFNTKNVFNMGNMFFDCYSLTNLNLSHFNTEKVTNMSRMFAWCSNLSKLNIKNFNTENVADMGDMFNWCNSLADLDLSNFDTSNVKLMNEMFSFCSNLTTIYASEKFTTNAVETDTNMFKSTPKLVGWNGTKWDSSKIDKTMAKIDKPWQEGYFTDKIWCSVMYDANGGIVDREKDSVVCGEQIQELATPTKEGAVFSGWYHNGVEVKVGDTLNERITVTAEWKESPKGPYTITLVNHGDITSGTTSFIIEYGKTILTPITKPTYTENTIQFQWYYTEPGGNGTQRIDNFGNWVNTTNSTFTHDTTLYAREPCARWSTLPECKPIVITFRVTDNGYFDYPRYLADWYDLYQLSTTCNNETSLYCDSTTTSQNFCLNGRQHKCNTRGLNTATYNSWNALTKTFQNKQEKGQNYRLYTPETKHNSKTFVGWFTQPAWWKQITNEDIVTSDITLYSQWTTWKIDGKCSNTRGDCLQWKATDVFENTETHQYEWVCKGENNGTNVPCSKDIEYTLSFNTLGWNDIPSQTGLYGGTRHEVDAPHRWKSIFLGWVFDEVEYTLPNTITWNVVLDANWECEEWYTSNKEGNECIEKTEDIEKYTIYYNANWWTWENWIPAPQERITWSTMEIIPDKPIREDGYWHFTIRRTSSTWWWGGLWIYQNNQGTTVIDSNFMNKYADQETKSLTLYAQKTQNICGITFNLQGWTKTCLSNDNTCSSSEKNTFSNTCLTSDSAIFRTSGKHWIAAGRTGYSFTGWKDESWNLLTENDIRSRPYLNQTYYAEWESTCRTGYVWQMWSVTMDATPDQYPYSWQRFSAAPWAFFTWTCPAKKQPKCGTTKNSCAVWSSYCDTDATDNTRVCYSDDDINLTVTCKGQTDYNFNYTTEIRACEKASGNKQCSTGDPQAWTTSTECNSRNLGTQYWLFYEYNTTNKTFCTDMDKYYDLHHIYHTECEGFEEANLSYYSDPIVYSTVYCSSKYNISWTPGWECPATNTIIYNFNYPWWDIITKYKDRDKNIYLSGNGTKPTRDHYTFKWWKSSTWTPYARNVIYTGKSDLTLYAVWEPDKISINYWTNEDQNNSKNNYKKASYSEYTYDSSSGIPKPTKEGFYFRGWYTIPQTDIPIYWVDANSFVITQDMIWIGNIKGNEAQIKAITNKWIDKKKIITKTEYTKLEEKSKQWSMRSQRLYKALLNTSTTIEKLIEEDHSYQLYTGIWTQSPHTNSKDTINLFAWWEYDQGIWRDSNYGSSKKGVWDWKKLANTVNYNAGQMDFYNETKEWDCWGGKGSCNSNKGTNYDYIGLKNDPTMKKGTKCNLSQNLPYPVGDLNFRYINWRDLDHGWDRFQVYGCYFAVGSTKSDWHLYDEVWGALAWAWAFWWGAMLTAVFSNPRSAIAWFWVLIGWLFVHNEKEWTYVFSQDQVFQLNNDSGRNWAYNPMTIKEWLKQHSTGTTWVAHLSSLKK